MPVLAWTVGALAFVRVRTGSVRPCANAVTTRDKRTGVNGCGHLPRLDKLGVTGRVQYRPRIRWKRRFPFLETADGDWASQPADRTASYACDDPLRRRRRRYGRASAGPPPLLAPRLLPWISSRAPKHGPGGIAQGAGPLPDGGGKRLPGPAPILDAVRLAGRLGGALPCRETATSGERPSWPGRPAASQLSPWGADG